jgi:hypothetical protein
MPTFASEMKYDNKKPTSYAICINESREETIRVLQLLFANGYVFDARYRLKTIDPFLVIYDLVEKTKFLDWIYLILNRDEECKMVITGWSCRPSDACLITVEDFLNLQKPPAVPQVKNNTQTNL